MLMNVTLFTSVSFASPCLTPTFPHLLHNLSLPDETVRSHAKHRGGRHSRMFVFTLQIYTIIFSTKFEPFELDREQKMVGSCFTDCNVLFS